jgi:hypothetical protein
MNRRAPFQYISSRKLRAKGGHPDESNDCSVRALVSATGLPYSTAHDIMTASGRPPRKGWHTDKGLKVLAELGAIKFSEIDLVNHWPLKPITLSTLLRRLPVGRYVCHTCGHAFALIDGVVHDNRAPGLNTRIEQCWRIEEVK